MCCEACPVTPNESQVAVTAAQTVVRPINAERKNLIVENFGATAVYLFFTTGGFANASILLPQYGVFNALQQGLIITGPVYAQTAAGSTTLGVNEET